MPLIIQEHPLAAASQTYFARVLSDQPGTAARLTGNTDNLLLVEAIFNGQPVALLLAERQSEGCKAVALVVHPATRGRGVGSELLRKGAALLPAPVEWAGPLRTLAEKHLAKT
jgi:GNAT superfamily N-acetyltransferase